MRIYIAHSQTIDYQSLYSALKKEPSFQNHEFILSHEKTDHQNNTRDFYKSLDVIIAEVSEPSTGLGIELGWAFDDNVPIYCFHQANVTPSKSIYATTDHISPYEGISDLRNQIRNIPHLLKSQA